MVRNRKVSVLHGLENIQPHNRAKLESFLTLLEKEREDIKRQKQDMPRVQRHHLETAQPANINELHAGFSSFSKHFSTFASFGSLRAHKT